ncbi:MAG: hypothetical protein KGZ25_10080, partial [Planctomycetes bacterium]|nr:hypothetical protein [Planctomycetota bacterium]
MKKALLKSSIFMAIAGWVLCIGASALAAERLQLEYGDRGLMSLKWAGQDILKDGKPSVGRIVLEKKTLADDGINEYDWQKPDVSEPRVKTERDGRRLVYTYKWGTITFNYASAPDRLELTTTIQNKADRTLAMFEVKPFTLSLPDPLDKPKHWKRIANMPGDFNVVQAVCGEHKLLLCCETVMPLHFGFGKPRKKNTVLPVTMRGNVNITRPGGVVYYHYGLPRIAPGKSP